MADSLEQGVKVRICPVCGTRNFGENIVCTLSGSSLVDVDFIYSSDSGKPQVAESFRDQPPPSEKNDIIKVKKPESSRKNLYETVVDRAPSLTFVSFENGKRFQAKNGAILGRGNVGGNEVFNEIDTVSRDHAKIYWDGVNWEIEPLVTSKNVTCRNGTELERCKRHRIKIGDTIHFSSQCSLKVSK